MAPVHIISAHQDLRHSTIAMILVHVDADFLGIFRLQVQNNIGSPSHPQCILILIVI